MNKSIHNPHFFSFRSPIEKYFTYSSANLEWFFCVFKYVHKGELLSAAFKEKEDIDLSNKTSTSCLQFYITYCNILHKVLQNWNAFWQYKVCA